MMGWSIGYDEKWKRAIGYGVPAECDHPGCTERIDRGLAHVCRNQEPYGGEGCGLYFCPAHLCGDGCERCAAGEEPFEPKADVPEWVSHVLSHDSWAEWRNQNPLEVARMTTVISQHHGGDVDERAAFEVWASETAGLNVEIEIDHAEYEHDSTRDAWDGWQARAALAAQPAVSAEPVAYQIRAPHVDIWKECDKDTYNVVRYSRPQHVRKLYAEPVAAHKPDGGDTKDAERWRKIVAHRVVLTGMECVTGLMPPLPGSQAAYDRYVDALPAIAQQRQEGK